MAAEVALLRDEPADAVVRAASAITLAEASGAPRHVAKGLLFQGVAEVQCGDLELSAVTLRRAAGLAESLGTLPLVWPARAVLGALLTEASAGRERRRRWPRPAPPSARSPTTCPRRSPRSGSLRPDIAALLEG